MTWPAAFRKVCPCNGLSASTETDLLPPQRVLATISSKALCFPLSEFRRVHGSCSRQCYYSP